MSVALVMHDEKNMCPVLQPYVMCVCVCVVCVSVVYVCVCGVCGVYVCVCVVCVCGVCVCGVRMCICLNFNTISYKRTIFLKERFE